MQKIESQENILMSHYRPLLELKLGTSFEMLPKSTCNISHPGLVDSSFRDSRDNFMIAAYFWGFSPSFSVLLQE